MIDSNKLRELRMLAGLSQRQLCKLAGIGPLGIKRIEDGADASRLPLRVVARIATALDVEIADLLDDSTLGGTQPARTRNPVEASVAPLDLRQARLLRRIHRGEDVTRSLSKTDRELTLPALLRLDVVQAREVRPDLTALARHSLSPPSSSTADSRARVDAIDAALSADTTYVFAQCDGASPREAT